jgi:hypothetical protein
MNIALLVGGLVLTTYGAVCLYVGEDTRGVLAVVIGLAILAAA